MATLTAIVMCAVSTVAMADDRTYDARNFDEISVSGANNVRFVQGDNYQVVAHGSASDLESLEVYVSGEKLVVRTRSGFRKGGSATVDVIAPRLEEVSASGASHISLGNVKSDEFEINCSGASSVKGDVESRKLDVECSGASGVNVQVKTGDVKVQCSGASHVNISGSCAHVTGQCSGASSVNLHGSAKSADVRCSGASSLRR